MPKITKLSKIIVVYDTIPNVVNMKFQVYLQIPGEIHFDCHNFSHGINILFFKIYVANEIFGGKMFSHSKFCKGNCLLLTSLFWILLKVFNIHDCSFHFKYYSKNLAWLNLFLEHSLSFSQNQRLKCYNNLWNRFWLLTVMMHERSYRNPAP